MFIGHFAADAPVAQVVGTMHGFDLRRDREADAETCAHQRQHRAEIHGLVSDDLFGHFADQGVELGMAA